MDTNSSMFRVAVLVRSHDDYTRIRQVMGTQYLGCTFDFYESETLEELRDCFLRLATSYDGFLSSGLLSDRFISYYSKDEVPHRYFSPSVESYYRTILLQIMNNPSLTVSDIWLDMMPPDENLADIISANRLGPLMQEERHLIRGFSPERVLAFEEDMGRRFEQIIQARRCKLFITRSYSPLEIFERYQIPYVRLNLTIQEVFLAVRMLRQDMELRKLKNSQIAAVCLAVGEESEAKDRLPEKPAGGDDASADGESVLQKLEEAARRLEQTPGKTAQEAGNRQNAGGTAKVGNGEAENGKESAGLLPGLHFHRVGSCLEAIADAGTIDTLTRERSSCGLTGFFQAETGSPVAVGYGIGLTIQEAQKNARTAAHYARSTVTSLAQSFLIDSDGQIIALKTNLAETAELPPFTGDKQSVEIFKSTIHAVAQKSHLASRTVLALMIALRGAHRDEISSDWLMSELGVSMRMANKILSNLEKAGYARVSGKSLVNGKGRPSNVYKVRWE